MNDVDLVSIDASGGMSGWAKGSMGGWRRHLQAARDAGEALVLLLGDVTITGGVE